jgi:DNA replication and repair protein RecF
VRISRFELRDFRSYDLWSIQPDSPLTVFAGPNAIGKTNIIEAIQLIATGSSFRNPRWEDVVRWGAESAAVTMTATNETSSARVDLSVDLFGARNWKVDGVTKHRVSQATRFVPIVAFTPDDLTLVKGPAERRRASIDGLGEQLSATYTSLRRDYLRVVRQRNALLKDEGVDAVLAPWDQQLIALGAHLYAHRRRLAKRVLEAAQPIYTHLAAGEVVDLRMCDRCGVNLSTLDDDIETSEIEIALTRELSRRRSEERARKVSLVGPHRDDLTFLIDGRDARAFASQGQQRTIALAWKWAEVVVVASILHKKPVLLLDDVMSELDKVRRGALTDLVQRDIQTFATTTNTQYFDPALLREARVVELGGGG